MNNLFCITCGYYREYNKTSDVGYCYYNPPVTNLRPTTHEKDFCSKWDRDLTRFWSCKETLTWLKINRPYFVLPFKES